MPGETTIHQDRKYPHCNSLEMWHFHDSRIQMDTWSPPMGSHNTIPLDKVEVKRNPRDSTWMDYMQGDQTNPMGSTTPTYSSAGTHSTSDSTGPKDTRVETQGWYSSSRPDTRQEHWIPVDSTVPSD